MTACIVGVGEPLAGDDAAGLRVIERLRAEPGLPPLELHALRDPSELAGLLPGHARVLVIDARLEPEQLGRIDRFELAEARALAIPARASLSSHGLDTLTAIELGRALVSPERFPAVTLLTIAIGRPERLGGELSPRVAEAVEEAAGRALAWAREAAHA